ncbi:MAG TPA: TRAP transporter permease [Thermodesulfobacteriota bacterium]|nr:TRAP transporter permease [Thermodesulfobacteriota bacterium]
MGPNLEKPLEVKLSTSVGSALHDRTLPGRRRLRLALMGVIAALWSLFHIYTSYAGILEAWRHRSVTLSFVLILSYLYFPSKGKNRSSLKGILITLYDNLGLLVSLACIAYMWFGYEGILDREGMPNANDLLFGGLTVLLVIEITRRTVGYGMAILSSCFIVYMLFGYYIPGDMGIPNIGYDKFIDTMFNSTYGLFGIIMGAMSTVVIIFVIFGGFLSFSKVGDFFIRFSYGLTGHRVGGPAKVAVVASGFMGMVSGAAASNVVTTGAFTIPLMKRVGYRPEFAGAVEASASMGGQIMPPVMGAAAFIIAEQLRVPYIKLCVYSIVPAILHFLAVGMMVHYEARKTNLPTLSKQELPDVLEIIKREGYLILPVITIVFFLLMGYTPQTAGFWSIVSVLVVTVVRKTTRMGWEAILSALETGGKNAISITAVCACSGIIVGSVIMTGLGLKLTRLVLMASGGVPLLGLFFVMIASLILGMGMTTVSAYVILAVLGVPALVKMGITPLAAHMFVFYFAIISNVTPPVAIASYAAAGIAGSNPFKTGVEGFRISLGVFIIPYIFALNPGLLMQGTPLQVVEAVVSATLGILCLTSALQGWMFVRMSPFIQILTGVASLGYLFPNYLYSLAGTCLLVTVVFQQRKKMKKLEWTPF